MRTSSAIAEGTVLTSVTSAAAGVVARARASSPSTTAPPAASGAKSSKSERSKLIEVEAKTPANSCGVKTPSAQRRKAPPLRCSIATPLGRPVEPEV